MWTWKRIVSHSHFPLPISLIFCSLRSDHHLFIDSKPPSDFSKQSGALIITTPHASTSTNFCIRPFRKRRDNNVFFFFFSIWRISLWYFNLVRDKENGKIERNLHFWNNYGVQRSIDLAVNSLKMINESLAVRVRVMLRNLNEVRKKKTVLLHDENWALIFLNSMNWITQNKIVKPPSMTIIG